MNICQTLQDILEEKKFRVRTANSGNQAIDLSKENNFDIVILDVMMPILNGFETYKKIKEINPNITAIMITGYEQEASTLIQAALDESVLACLSKPLEHNKIFSLIKKVSQGKIIGKKLPKPLMKKVFRMIAETIMIVDDDNNLCETLSDIFSYKGINSITAHTGKEAINKSKEFSPSVVLIDIKLPDMEGTQLFQELKKGNPELICIYISGYASLEHTLTAFKNEAEGFFVKPLPLEELLARTEELLEKKRLKEALRKSEEKFRHLSENLEIQVEERTRDLLQTQGKLIRQERLGIFGQIAGGIAHEFNNILSTIIGATDILLEDVKNKDSIKMLEVILKQSLLASELAKKMLDFSKFTDIKPKVVDLEEFFEELRDIFSISFSVNLTITSKMNLGKLLIDPFQLQQALMNLLINSKDALSEKGRITIIISSVTDEDVSDFELNKVKSGNYVNIQIEDNGTGMSKEVQNNIFVPFYSTKPIGKGSGLGLSQVYGIIRQYSGYIDFESEERKGTRFNLYLPQYVQE